MATNSSAAGNMLASNALSSRLLKQLAAIVDTTAATSPAAEELCQAIEQHGAGDASISRQDVAQTLVCGMATAHLARRSGYLKKKQQAAGFSPLADALLQAAVRDANLVAEIDAAMTDLCHSGLSTQQAEQWWLHLYESLLHKQQAKRRRQQGVYYTPREVVRYMVRQVHETLQREFDLPLGLAATITWRQAAAKYGLQRPADAEPGSHFLQILDPAAGSGAFVLEIIQTIHATMFAHYRAQNASEVSARARWRRYVVSHLLPRLHAWERMPTAHALLHLNVALKLAAMGCTFRHGHGATGLRCTDSLDRSDANTSLPHTVMLGNPPFGRQSQHLGQAYEYLLEPLRMFGGSRIREPGAIVFERDINNDYVKFLSFARWCGERTPAMVGSLITPASYLDGRNFRGLREALLQRFPAIAITQLGGDRRRAGALDKQRDANVFPIEAGVCVATMHRAPLLSAGCTTAPRVEYSVITGDLKTKLKSLKHGDVMQPAIKFAPSVQRQLSFVPDSRPACSLYQSFTPLCEIFEQSVDGVKTSRDGLLTALTREECAAKMQQFVQCKTAAQVQQRFRVATGNWDWKEAQRHVAATFDASRIQRLAYRPFDFRFLYYDRQLVFSDRWAGMRHLMESTLDTPENIAVVCASRLASAGYEHALAADCVVEMKYASHNTNSRVFPALRMDEAGQTWRSNISPTFSQLCGRPENSLNDARDIAAYVLAALHDPAYRARHQLELKDALPRIPAPESEKSFRQRIALGRQLFDAYLMREKPPLLEDETETPGVRNCRFITPIWAAGDIQISEEHSTVASESIFHTTVAGYQVPKTWFSAGIRCGVQRRGAAYCPDMKHEYQRVLSGLQQLQQIFQKIRQISEK